MPVREFNEQFLASALMGAASLLEMNILLGLDERGAFLKLVRRADNVPFFEFAFNDDMILRWADDLRTIRQQQHEREKLVREEAERERVARIKEGLGECKVNFICPTCGASGSADEYKQYGRVVCPCWVDSADEPYYPRQ